MNVCAQRMRNKTNSTTEKLSYELVFTLNLIRHTAIHCHIPIDFKRANENDGKRKTKQTVEEKKPEYFICCTIQVNAHTQWDRQTGH